MLDYEHTDVPPPGYELSGPDNNAGMYLWSGEEWDACPECGRFLVQDVVNRNFNLDVDDDELIDYGMGGIEEPAAHSDAKRIFDFSFTYDGWSIVSTTFRDIVLSKCSTAVKFGVLPREPNFFAMMPTEVVEVDTQRSHHKLEPLCDLCGEPKGAHGGASNLRDTSRLDPHGMYRSDVERGSLNRMSPTIYVGPELAHHLRPLNGVILYHAVKW